MIAKGVPHAHGARLARYLINGKDGELAELLELRGFAVDGIVDAFRSVQVMAKASKCVFPFFHVSVRNPQGEKLGAVEWTRTADAIEQSLDLVDQPRAIAFHICQETGERHMHVAWSRIDQEFLRAKPLPYFKERLKRVCRELEKQFELTEVSSVRKGLIAFAPTRAEEEQSRRLGIDLRDHRETFRECFERSDCGRSFQLMLGEQGIVLARGDRRDFLAIDPAGGMHALGKKILGVSAAAIRARLSDLCRDQLPTVEEARQAPRATQALLTPVIETPRLQPLTKLAEEEVVPLRVVGEVEQASSPEHDVSDLVLPPDPGLPQAATPETVDVPNMATDAVQKERQYRGLAATLKRQFRAAVNALFKRSPSPQLLTRRRRTGETVGSFRSVAQSLLRPIIRLPAVSRVVGFLNDTLPWLNLWEWNAIADHDTANAAGSRDDNNFSPHP